MGSRSFWLRILNVYPEEWNIVKRLYIFQFFQGAGIAFFFTSAFSRFLERFPITQLPWVMVCSAVLLWITGLAYTRLEHALKFTKFSVAIIVFMAVSILLLWLASFAVSADWFYYIVIAWFEVLYLLNNMEFWGIASLIFDLRQSKRLFGVISAGDIPAKFIGYTLAWFFVPYTGTQNLLLIGAACILASLIFYKEIVRLGKLDAHDHLHHEKKKKQVHKIAKTVTNIATNTYVRRIAFISLIATTCVILINYGFYGEVKKEYHDDVELAKFISFFYAGLRLVAFITKMIFTSRITSNVGIRSALFITPVGMVLLIGLITISGWMWPQEKLIFYLFGVAAMLIDVLRTSFNSPVLLTLMQPLSTHDRLRAHNIVKGIMDPFASFLSGAFLLLLFYMHNKVDLMFLCYVLLVLGGLWAIGVILVNRQYLQILYKMIGARFFGSEEFDLKNEAIIEQIRNKLKTGNEIEIINILRILNNKEDAVADDLIAELLQHPSDNIKLEVLRLIKNRDIANVKERLATLLQSNVSLEVKVEVIKTLCKIGKGDWNLAAYLADPEEKIRSGAIAGMLSNTDERVKGMAEAGISNLLSSSKKEDKEKVISILNEIKNEYESPAYMLLLNDADPSIRNLVIKAAGKASSEETLAALLKHIIGHEKQVLAALYSVGEKTIPLLEEYIINAKASDQLKEKLVALCGKIGGEKAKEVLLHLLKTQPQYTSAIIKALHRCKYKADTDMQKQMEAIARTYIINGVELLFMQQGLSKKDPGYNVLNNSLQYEIQEIREILLHLFGCMYDRDKINQVKNGLNMKQRESIANAMEIIELTVKKDIGRQFNTMFEATSIEQRCTALRSLFTENKFGQVENILGRILSEKPINYYDWTKACSIYISKKYAHPLAHTVYEKYVSSDSKLLKETALFAVASS